jgi:hypothetical protein
MNLRFTRTAIGCLLFLFSSTFISAQSTLSDEEQEMYAKLGVTITGNASVDAQNYDAAKAQLKQQNPTLFAQYFGSPIPANYPYKAIPGFTPTGDLQTDQPLYQQAKLNLYQNNPQAFQQYFGQPNNQVVKQISRAEYNALPPAKKQKVDNEGYEIID